MCLNATQRQGWLKVSTALDISFRNTSYYLSNYQLLRQCVMKLLKCEQTVSIYGSS